MLTLRGVGACATTLLVATTALIGIAPAAIAAGPPTAPHTAFTTHFEGWGYSYDGTFSYEATRTQLEATQYGGNGFALTMYGNRVDNWRAILLTISPPTGTQFVAGQTYPTITAYGPSAATTVLNVESNGKYCDGSGTVTILEAAYDEATGQFTAFAANYSSQCKGSPQTVKGEIRFKSSLDYRTADNWVDGTVNFQAQPVDDPGTPKQIKIDVNGSVPTTFGAASIGGANPSAFRITANECTGTTLSYGQSCQLTVVPYATAVGRQTAVLALADDSFAGRVTSNLMLDGVLGVRGTYFPVYPTPFRILDTRSQGRLQSGQALPVKLGGIDMTAATAVVLNVTVTESFGPGFISVYPTGVPRPTVSSVNFASGWTGANSVTVKLGADGAINLYNGGSPVHIIVDVLGWYTKPQPANWISGGQYFPLSSPIRLTDTREWGQGRIPGDYYINSYVSFNDAVKDKVRALAVNITSTDSRGPGFLTAWNGIEDELPGTSTLNYTAGRSVPNFAIVPVSRCTGSDCGSVAGMPRIGVYTNNDTHIIVDIVGFYDDGTMPNGLRFEPNVPTRIADTREGKGWPSALTAGATATIDADVVSTDDTYALATNVTAVLPTESTYVTVWPANLPGVGKPGTSNLNPTTGSIVPNAVQTEVGPGNLFNVYNHLGRTDIVVDVVGTFYLYPPRQPAPAKAVAEAPKAVPRFQMNEA
ncbi:MAG TPA: hypothetical protein VM677_21475 [Actinokineospora sp.]|jgi:hypothetical protein|nr:hypothetical protein [Actinokineospora sp.]